MFPGLIRLISLDGSRGKDAARSTRGESLSPEIPIICPVPIKRECSCLAQSHRASLALFDPKKGGGEREGGEGGQGGR